MTTATAFVWTDAQVREALGLPDDDREVRYSRISTDSRDLEAGDLFVALEGPNFDGHEFVDQAVAGGAAGLVVHRAVDAPAAVPVYRVPDTLVALGRLARHRRRSLSAQVVGITGSSGKTTTKELLRAAVGGSMRVHANRGNLNNRIGVPLTLLEAPEATEVLVAEMGTSEPGEIGALTEIVVPDVGVLITVSESHLDGLGTLDGVMREKLALIRGLSPEAVAIVGDTPEELPRAARAIRPDVQVAGVTDTSDPELRATALEADDAGCYSFRWQGRDVTLAVPGRHMVANAAVALAAASALDVPVEAALQGIATMRPAGMRGEERRVGDVTLILDCYNANPQSTRAALATLADRRPSGSRVAFLGTMLELGGASGDLHDDVLRYALSLDLDRIVATGAFADAARIRESETLIREEDPEAAYDRLRRELSPGSLVLLKASRGVALERLVPRFEEDFGGGGED